MKDRLKNLVYIFILIGPLVDLLTSVMIRVYDFNFTIGVIFRGIFLLIMLIYIIFFNKSKYKKISLIYIGLLALFSCIYLLLRESIFTEFKYLFKYLYFPITLIGLVNLNDETKFNTKLLVKILQINVIVYAVLVFIPIITNTSFSSYDGLNLGYIGWFYSANEIGAIFTLLYPFTFYILYKNRSIISLILMLLVIFSMSLIGTKTPFIAMILSNLIFGLYFLSKRKKLGIKPFVSVIIATLLIIVMSPSFSVTSNMKKTLNIKENPEAALSKRDEFLDDIRLIDDEVGTEYKIVGLGFTQNEDIKDEKITKLIEMDFHDVYYRFGVLGFLLYFLPTLIIFYFTIKKVIKLKFRLGLDLLIYGFCTGITMFVSMLAGHILGSPAVSIYLSLMLLFLIKEITNEKIELKDEVCIYVLHLGYGGVEKYVSSLCKMLESKYSIKIISTYKLYKTPPFNFSKNIKIEYLIDSGPRREEFKKSLKTFNIFKIVSESVKNVDILFKKYFLNLNSILNNNSKYIITTRIFHNKLVGDYANIDTIKIATEHNYIENKRNINKLLSSVTYFNYFVVVSKKLESVYKNRMIKATCVYIPNVIDELPKNKSKLNTNNIINVGRFAIEKGLFDLIDVFELVNKEIKDSKLYLVGDGYLKEKLVDYVKEKDLKNSIVFTGFLSHEKIEKYYLDSSLYAMTSFTESFGLTLIESASYGVPEIAFDSASGAREILKDAGILIKNRDKNKMANKIITLLKNKKELKLLSDKCFKNSQKYLLGSVKEEWYSLLKRSK